MTKKQIKEAKKQSKILAEHFKNKDKDKMFEDINTDKKEVLRILKHIFKWTQ